MQATQTNKKIQLVNGSFTPAEVNNLIIDSIDNQINNYKLKNLSNWIHDNDCDQESYANAIHQLEERKRELQNIIKEAKSAGCRITLTENVEISLEN